MGNSYETLNRIYDQAEAKVKKLLRAEMDAEEREKIGLMARSFDENVAYYVLNYAAQVLNGGHAQWAENGYIQEIDQLRTVLRVVNSKHCGEVLAFLSQIEIACPDGEVPYDEEDENNFTAPFESLDTAFYRMDKEFLDEIAAFIEIDAITVP